MSKKINVIGLDARAKAIEGVNKLAKPIKDSIGPFGLNILSEKGNKISNDGAFIAQELLPTLTDEFERRGATVVNENINKINDEIGDFSSTAWAFHDALIKESVRYLGNDKTIKAQKTYSEIAQMIEKSKDEVVAELNKMAKIVESKEELIKAALVSVEDEKLAELLGTTQWEMGSEGRIIAEETNDKESSIEKTNGILLDNGFVSSNLVTNVEKNSLEINAPVPILLTNYTIGEPEMKVLRENIFKTLVTQKKTSCILMARAFTSEAIKESQENFKTFPVILLNAPYTDQREVMKDIEAVVGGRYIDTEEASLQDIYITDVGCANRIVARQFNAQISGLNDEQAKERVSKRVEVLRGKLKGSESDFERRMISERIAQLTDGFAILKVGSKAVNDRKRLKDKADDAVNTVRHALKEGTVKGAGLAWKEISDKMEEGNILKRPLLCVYNQIVTSAPDGWEAPEWVRDSVLCLKVVLERTCAFVPTFVSINAIATTKDPKECDCK